MLLGQGFSCSCLSGELLDSVTMVTSCHTGTVMMSHVLSRFVSCHKSSQSMLTQWNSYMNERQLVVVNYIVTGKLLKQNCDQSVKVVVKYRESQYSTSKADWIVFQTLIGDLNFVSKSLRNFQSSQKRPFSPMDMKKSNRILVNDY